MRNPIKHGVIEISTEKIEPDSWGHIAESYWFASNILLNHVASTEEYVNKWVCYSILFNIRHYYELALKDILFHLDSIIEIDPFKAEHDLAKLIDKLEKDGKGYSFEEFEKSINELRKNLSLFLKNDNNSFGFRYPYHTKGELMLHNTVHFEVNEIRKSFIKARHILNSFSTMVLRDDKNDRMYRKK